MTKLNKIRMKLYSAFGIICLLLVIGAGFYAQGYSSENPPEVVMENVNIETYNAAAPTVEQELGAASSPVIPFDTSIYGSLTYGVGDYIATSSSGAASTLAFSDLSTSFISFTSNVSAYTFTMPATSTMFGFLPHIGATRKWLIHNATTTAATTLTIAKGAGMDIVSVTTDDDLIDGGEFTQVTCTRIPYLAANNEEVMCIVDELANSD